MAELLNNLSDCLEIAPENLNNTAQVILELKDKDNKEVCTQIEILSNLKERFNAITGISAQLNAKRIGKGYEDGTIIVTVAPNICNGIIPQIFRIGCEVKHSTCSKYATEQEYCNMCLVQEAYYINTSYSLFTTKYHIICAITDKFIRFCYLHKNNEAYLDLCNALSLCTQAPSSLWKAHKIDLSSICDRFIWEPFIYIDKDFKFTDVVIKILNDMSKTWK